MLPSAKLRGVWRVEILIPRDKHAGELFSAATATSTMVTLLVSINSGLDTLAWPGSTSTSASVSLPISLPTIRTMVSNRLIVDLNRSTSISDALSLFVEKRRPVDHGVVAWVMIYVWYGFYVHHLSPPPRASTSETQNSLHISDFCDRISGSSHFLKQHTKLNWNTTTLAY
jgi:hypothetical protein